MHKNYYNIHATLNPLKFSVAVKLKLLVITQLFEVE